MLTVAKKLQRKIAATRGISNAQALASPKRSTPSLEDKPAEESQGTTPKLESKDDSSTNQPSGKRKYRRHPKPDENAPERPPSAYVIFSNSEKSPFHVLFNANVSDRNARRFKRQTFIIYGDRQASWRELAEPDADRKGTLRTASLRREGEIYD